MGAVPTINTTLGACEGLDVVWHSRRLIFQLSEVSVPRRLFEGVLDRIGRLSPVPS